MALIPPRWIDCVVGIGFRGTNEVNYAATGFLYGQHRGNQQYALFLITNKHVFEGQEDAVARFNTIESKPAREFDFSLVDEQGKLRWTAHSEVDLAWIGINPSLLEQEGIKFGFFQSDQNVGTKDELRSSGVSEGDGVFILGFPMGLVGKNRNFVIVRRGCIARIRDAYENQSNEILVDATIFPGNSGGPVILKPEAIAIGGTNAVSEALLIGVVASYIPYEEVAVSTQTNQPRVIFEENSGLASVIPIDYLHTALNQTAPPGSGSAPSHEQ